MTRDEAVVDSLQNRLDIHKPSQNQLKFKSQQGCHNSEK